MAFCEECGAKLADGVKFCEECGTEVPVSHSLTAQDDKGAYSMGMNTMPSFDLFDGFDWPQKWQTAALSSDGCELGLIITRESELLSQLHAAPEELREMLGRYIAKAAGWGVMYSYCNLDDCLIHEGEGSVDAVVATLRKIVDVARPRYLLILGNEDVVDVARWENQARDGDEIVESDLCYSTLDSNTPWNGQKYNFDEIMRVGRLPSYNGESFSSYSRYFDPLKMSTNIWTAWSTTATGSSGTGSFTTCR